MNKLANFHILYNIFRVHSKECILKIFNFQKNLHFSIELASGIKSLFFTDTHNVSKPKPHHYTVENNTVKSEIGLYFFGVNAI